MKGGLTWGVVATFLFAAGCVQTRVIRDNSINAQLNRSIPQNGNWQMTHSGSGSSSDLTPNAVPPGKFIFGQAP